MTDENQAGQEPIEQAPVPAPEPLAEAPQAPAQWPAAPPPPGYPAAGAPVYAYPPAYPPAPKTSSNAIISLVLSIAAWVVCPIVPAIVALVFASMASKEIDASGDQIQGRGMVTASKIVSWINIGFYVALIVVGAFVLVLLAIAGGMDNVNNN